MWLRVPERARGQDAPRAAASRESVRDADSAVPPEADNADDVDRHPSCPPAACTAYSYPLPRCYKTLSIAELSILPTYSKAPPFIE